MAPILHIANRLLITAEPEDQVFTQELFCWHIMRAITGKVQADQTGANNEPPG